MIASEVQSSVGVGISAGEVVVMGDSVVYSAVEAVVVEVTVVRVIGTSSVQGDSVRIVDEDIGREEDCVKVSVTYCNVVNLLTTLVKSDTLLNEDNSAVEVVA